MEQEKTRRRAPERKTVEFSELEKNRNLLGKIPSDFMRDIGFDPSTYYHWHKEGKCPYNAYLASMYLVSEQSKPDNEETIIVLKIGKVVQLIASGRNFDLISLQGKNYLLVPLKLE